MNYRFVKLTSSSDIVSHSDKSYRFDDNGTEHILPKKLCILSPHDPKVLYVREFKIDPKEQGYKDIPYTSAQVREPEEVEIEINET